jgi:hypothetical protein
VGDSILVSLEGRSSWAFIYKSISDAQHRHNIQLSTRLVEKDKRRVWRVA